MKRVIEAFLDSKAFKVTMKHLDILVTLDYKGQNVGTGWVMGATQTDMTLP